MATKTTKTTTRTTSGSFSWRRITNFCAFVAIVLIAVALVLAKIFNGNQVSSAMTLVANFIAYFIACVCAFFFARSKRHWGYLVAWLVSVILIVVFMFLNM